MDEIKTCGYCFECQKCFSGQSGCDACFECQRCFGCQSGIAQRQSQSQGSQREPRQQRQRRPQQCSSPLIEERVREIVLETLIAAGLLDEKTRKGITL